MAQTESKPAQNSGDKSVYGASAPVWHTARPQTRAVLMKLA